MAKNWLLIISSVLVLPFNFFIFGTASAKFGAGGGFFLGCIFYWIYVSLFVLLLNEDDFHYFRKIDSPNAEPFHLSLPHHVLSFNPPIVLSAVWKVRKHYIARRLPLINR